MCANGGAFFQSACVRPLRVQSLIHSEKVDGHKTIMRVVFQKAHCPPMRCRASDRRFKTVFKAVRPNVAMF